MESLSCRKERHGGRSLQRLLRFHQLFHRVLHRANNLVVARATAKISGELEADFVLGWIVRFVEQRFSSDKEAGSADAALQCGPFQEALLQRMQAALLGEAFDRF